MALEKLKFIMEEEPAPRTRIRVFGIGGGGSNAVARMMTEGMSGIEFCVLNTDAQALEASPVPHRLAIGAKAKKLRGVPKSVALQVVVPHLASALDTQGHPRQILAAVPSAHGARLALLVRLVAFAVEGAPGGPGTNQR